MGWQTSSGIQFQTLSLLSGSAAVRPLMVRPISNTPSTAHRVGGNNSPRRYIRHKTLFINYLQADRSKNDLSDLS
jgi:hypothetical protein